MSRIDLEDADSISATAPIPRADVDLALTAQLIVAWAGEAADQDERPRLRWWRSNLCVEDGGEDLFRRLLPSTWRWATLRAVREAARRQDAEQRRAEHDADRILSLFHLGFSVDERLDERLAELQRAGRPPTESLPGLALIDAGWSAAAFSDWVEGHGRVEVDPSPVGRRLRGAVAADLALRVRKLVAALAPIGPNYPLPHLRQP